jgi:hypothetical protein
MKQQKTKQQRSVMELRRRFVFRGNAAAFGGRIVRPEDIVFEMPGASSLPISGGRSVAKIPRTQFKDYLSFESASTFAEGLFDDLDGAIALSHHRVREDTLKTSTRVHAEIRKITIGRQHRVTADRLSAELISHSPTGSGEPPIALGEVAIEGFAIDGFPLKVELERGIFRRYDTHAKLLNAADQPEFVKKYGSHLFMNTDFDGWPAPQVGRLVPGRSRIYGTIVKSIEWSDRRNPAAQIDHHSVVVKDFGRIFFGELFISASARRLTMMRLELGSEDGGAAGGPDVDINGGWSP